MGSSPHDVRRAQPIIEACSSLSSKAKRAPSSTQPSRGVRRDHRHRPVARMERADRGRDPGTRHAARRRRRVDGADVRSVPPAKWQSRSGVLTYDPEGMLFEHTSRSDMATPATWRGGGPSPRTPTAPRSESNGPDTPRHSGGDSCSPVSGGASSRARCQRPCTHSRTTSHPGTGPLTPRTPPQARVPQTDSALRDEISHRTGPQPRPR